ncbi:unnamed protein product [Calypogeia fissa]
MGEERSLKVRDGRPVVKAPSDQRLYQVIHLENGLTALLIHDPLMVDTTASGDGHVGSGAASSSEEAESGTEIGSEEEEEGEEDEDEEDEDEEEDKGSNKGKLGHENHHHGGMDLDNSSHCHDGHCGHEHHDDNHEHESSRKRSHMASQEGGETDGEEEMLSDEEEGASTRKPSGMAPTKKAAAAMCVGVGSFSDPQDAQGLAHFLEHMLFMGSSKFPDENEYDFFLSKHGGGSNAFTDTEYTCYHFDVNHNHLKPALDRFSQFFVAPLAKAEAMNREVQAIDSEFNQVLQSDSCRLLQLQCHTANPKHPFHTFSWGNKESLGVPMAKGADMRGKMFELYEKCYTAGRMRLTVLGGEPLETLKNWVTELFGEVRGGNEDRLRFSWTGPIWEKGRLYMVESVKDQHVVSLIWPFPCLESAYLKKPQDYISHLVGHEGSGSLLSLLKEKGWATGLSAGVGEGGYERSSAGYMFNVNIHLTAVGLEHVLDVVGLFYQYLKMLRETGPQEWVFHELQAMAAMEFKFAEEESADNYVVRMASNMHMYSEEHTIYGDYAFEEWDAKQVNDLLSIITPENMRLDVLSKQFDRNAPGVKLEPWFGVPYTVEVLSDEVIQVWAHPPHVDSALHMPMVNEFIPRDFSLRSVKPGADTADVPRMLRNDSSVKVWYKLDKTFNTPRANAYFSVTLGAAYKNVKAHVLAEIYVKLLHDALIETLYLANVAKLESSMSVSGGRLELKLFGFNEKLPVLAHKIAELYRTFVPSEDRFQAMKEDLERFYRNTNMKPLKHSAYLRLQIVKQGFWHVDEKLASLLSLTLKDVLEFVPQLFEQTYMEVLCHGNLSEDEALVLVNIFKDAFVSKVLPPELRPQELVYKLPVNSFVLDADVKNESEDNSVVEMYFQVEQDVGEQSLRSRAMLDLFEEIVYEPCFNQLRTKEQLGYRVDCGVRVTHQVLGFCFRVQSSKYPPVFLHERINVCIGTLRQILADMSDEEFGSYKEALIADKMERDHSLIDETDRYWEQIWEKRYLFEARKLEAMEVQGIQKRDVIDWFSHYVNLGSPSERKLSIHIWGSNCSRTDAARKAEIVEKVTKINDVSAFKNTLELFPAPM